MEVKIIDMNVIQKQIAKEKRTMQSTGESHRIDTNVVSQYIRNKTKENSQRYPVISCYVETWKCGSENRVFSSEELFDKAFKNYKMSEF